MNRSHLLVIGSNPETAALVKVAKDEGHLVTVVDPVENSPAKKIADYSFCIDGFDVDSICDIATSTDVTGVLIGVLDVLMPSYFNVCNRLGFPCYANEKTIQAFSSKLAFSSACAQFGIPSIPSFRDPSLICENDFPVLVKPVDSGAGIGISICRSSDGLRSSIDKAQRVSKSGGVLIEKYMQCADMSAYYTFVDGFPVLTATTDRFTSRFTDFGSPVCIGASYPSRFEQDFLSVVHPKLLQLFSSLDIRAGVFNLQLFYEQGQFFAYDPGFRLQGEGYHFHIFDQAGVDQRKMLIDFALGRTTDYQDASISISDFRLCRDSRALTVWVLLREGTIARVSGLNLIRSLEPCFFILERLGVGDVVTSSMVGTEKQVFCRIYMRSDSIESLRSASRSVVDLLEIESEDGRCMVLDIFSPDLL